jgi:hypothetical protein
MDDIWELFKKSIALVESGTFGNKSTFTVLVFRCLTVLSSYCSFAI